MIKKIIVGVSAIGILTSCQNKCPDSIKEISLAQSSTQLQALFGSDDSHIRGMKTGSSISAIQESDADLQDTASFYVNYMPDLTDDFWADVTYVFDDEQNVMMIETEIQSSAIETGEKIVFLDSLHEEITDYFSSKYGRSITDSQYKRVWNEVNVKDNSLTIFTMDFEIPENDFTIKINEETGKQDTTFNEPVVKLLIDHL